MGAKVELGAEAMADMIKTKVLMKIGIGEQTLYEVFTSILHNCITRMDVTSIVKENASKFTLRPILIRYTKWEQLELSEPTEVVNLRHYRLSGE